MNEKDNVYLDNGSTSYPKPDEVLEFAFTFYKERGKNPDRGSAGTGNCPGSDEMVGEARAKFAHFFGGDKPERLCFTYNATDSLNMVVNGMLHRGDHLVTTVLEHNAVLRPAYHKSDIDGDIEVSYVGINGNCYVNPDDIKKAIGKNTKLVMVNHASNVFGTVQPIAEIGAICREKGVPFAIDAAQTAGVVNIDVERDNVDVVCFTGHKSLMSPTGIGGIYVHNDVDIRTTRFGGTGIKSAVKPHLTDYPYRLEAGTLNVCGVAGAYAGLDFIERQGMSNIHERELALFYRLAEGLAGIDTVTTYFTASQPRLAVLSTNIEGMQPKEVGGILVEEFAIATRPGLHCAPLAHEAASTAELGGTVRFGIGPFNTEEHIDRAIEAMTAIAGRG